MSIRFPLFSHRSSKLTMFSMCCYTVECCIHLNCEDCMFIHACIGRKFVCTWLVGGWMQESRWMSGWTAGWTVAGAVGQLACWLSIQCLLSKLWMGAFDVGHWPVMSPSEGPLCLCVWLCICTPDIPLHMCCCGSVITEHLQSWKFFSFF